MTSAFKVVESVLKVALLPSHILHPLEAAKDQINDMLFKFNEDLEGVPVVYYDLKFPPGKEYGRIMNELPWLHVDIIAKLLVFKPQVGQKLIGQINKVSDSHVSLLICGMFNASILESELSSKYKYNESTQCWESSTEYLWEGDYIEFEVRCLHHSQGVFYMDGAPLRKCNS